MFKKQKEFLKKKASEEAAKQVGRMAAKQVFRTAEKQILKREVAKRRLLNVLIWIIAGLLQAFFGGIAVIGAAVAMFGDTAVVQFWGAVILIVSSLISSLVFVKGWGKSIF